jgi:outer membrane lipoprotein-sorting protein
VVALLGAVLAGGQAAPDQKPLMAEQVFKNVQVLRGIPVNEFMSTMGFFSASLGANCIYCHAEESGGDWSRYADDNPNKQTARKMILMMNAINQSYFAKQRVVTCYTCHHLNHPPKVVPSLVAQYSAPFPEEPDEVLEQAPGAASADQILDKYIEALGGIQRLANFKSFVAKGTYVGFTEEKNRIEMFAKAPNQRATIVHAPEGDTSNTFDGISGWVSAPTTDTPVPMLALTGAFLDAAKLDADLTFPTRIKQSLSDWRVGFPDTIEGRDVQVVQGKMATDGLPVQLFFDSDSGLLVRMVRYVETPVGRAPTEIDYSDYREVAGVGVKMPFRWAMTWTDGRATTELTEVQSNVSIDASKFAKPATAVPRAAR